MSPTSPNNQPGFELPEPQSESKLPALPAAETVPLRSEQQSRQAELPGSSQPTGQAGLPPAPLTAGTSANNLATVMQDPLPAASATALPTPVPAVADDTDLIEKEWVEKAKAIVDHTRDDPHKQNRQLNEFKADYMKKRYGKEIRLEDEPR